MKKQKVPTFESSGLLKIRVQDVIENDGWKFGRYKLKAYEDRIDLFRDNEYVGCWKLFSQEIAQLPPILKMEDGSFKCHRSPTMVFMVYGKRDGKRYRFLYSDGRNYFDTRTDLGIRYSVNCFSRKQRKEDEILKLKRLIRKKRHLRSERRFQKRLSENSRYW